MHIVEFLTAGGQKKTTVVPDSGSEYAARAAVRRRKDCDFISSCVAVAKDRADAFSAKCEAEGLDAALAYIVPQPA